MVSLNRRTLLGCTGAAAGAGLFGRSTFANPNGLPVGLQLYSVADDLV